MISPLVNGFVKFFRIRTELVTSDFYITMESLNVVTGRGLINLNEKVAQRLQNVVTVFRARSVDYYPTLTLAEVIERRIQLWQSHEHREDEYIVSAGYQFGDGMQERCFSMEYHPLISRKETVRLSKVLAEEILLMPTCYNCSNITFLALYTQDHGRSYYECCARKAIMMYLTGAIAMPREMNHISRVLAKAFVQKNSQSKLKVFSNYLNLPYHIQYDISRFDCTIDLSLNCPKSHVHNEDCKAFTFSQQPKRKMSIARSNSGSRYFTSYDSDHKFNSFFFIENVKRGNAERVYGDEDVMFMVDNVDEAKHFIVALKDSLEPYSERIAQLQCSAQAKIDQEIVQKAKIYALECRLRNLAIVQESHKEDRASKIELDIRKELERRYRSNRDKICSEKKVRKLDKNYRKTCSRLNKLAKIDRAIVQESGDSIFSSLKDMFTSVVRRVFDFGKGLSQITSLISKVPHLKDKIDNITSKISGFVSGTVEEVKRVFKDISTPLIIHLITWMQQRPTTFGVFMAFVGLFERAFPELFSQVYSKIAASIFSVGGLTDIALDASIEPESDSENGILACAISAFTSTVSGLNMPVKKAWKVLSDTTKEIKNMKSQISETWKAIEWVKTCFKSCFEWIFNQRLNEVHVPGVDKLGDFIHNVSQIQAFNRKEIADGQNQMMIRACMKEAAIIQDCIFKKKLDNLSTPSLRVLERAITNLNHWCNQHHVLITESHTAFRQPAMWIYVCGESGTGKSSSIEVTSQALFRHSPISTRLYDPKNLIYVHNPSTEYDNMYCGQFVFVIDDVFQIKEVMGMAKADSEALKMVHLISPAPTEINHSVSEQKGGVFDSPIVLTTSNCYYPKSAAIKSAKALHRRRSVVVQVTRIPGPMTLENMRFSILPNAVRYDGRKWIICRDDGSKEEAFDDDQIKSMGCDPATIGRSLSNPKLLDMTFENYCKYLIKEFHRKTRSGYAQQFTEYNLDNIWISEDEIIAHIEKFGEVHEAFEGNDDYCQIPILETVGAKRISDETVKEDAFFDAQIEPEGADEERVGEYLELQKQFNECFPDTGRPSRWSEGLEAIVEMYHFIINHVNSRIILYFVLMISCIVLFASLVCFIGLKWRRSQLEEECYQRAKATIGEYADQLDRHRLPELYKMVDEYVEKRFSEQESHSYGSDKLRKPQMQRAIINSKIQPRAVNTIVQQGNSVNTVPAVQKNLVRVWINGHRACGLAICGKWIMVPDHILYQAPESELEIAIEHPSRVKTFYRTDLNKSLETNFDYRILYIENMNDFKDIRHLFASDKESADLKDGRCVAVRRREDMTYIIECTATRHEHYDVAAKDGVTNGQVMTETDVYRNRFEKYGCDKTARNLEYLYSKYGDGNVKLVVDWIQTNNPLVDGFEKGDCGSVLLCGVTGHIIGIYQGKNRDTKLLWCPLNKDIFKELTVGFVHEDPKIDLEACVEDCEGVPKYSIIKDQLYKNHVPRESNIIPTILHGKVVEIGKDRACLSAFDPRLDEEHRGQDLLMNGFQNNFNPTRPVRQSTLERASASVQSKVNAVRPALQAGRRLLTDDEILNGIPGEYKGIEMGTSLGIPYKNMTREKGKHGVFEMKDNKRYWRDTPVALAVQRDMVDAEAKMKQGIIPFVAVTEQTKDECLKPKKIPIGRTRTFECFPAHIMLIVRKYFGAFIAAQEKECIFEPVSVGLNAHDHEWKLLYQRLKKHGGKVIAGDYAFWDKGLHGSLIKQAIRIINRWYNDSAENQRLREALGEIFVETNVIVGDLLYKVQQGMPSGVALTSVLNSIVNWLLITCCIYEILLENGRLDLFDQANWELALYGDDHIIALARALQEYVTFSKVKDFMNDLGIGYTDSAKTDRVFDFEELEEVSYLKRMFVPLPCGRVLAPLEKISVENPINWCQSGHYGPDTIMPAWNGIKLEAFHWGKEYYEQLTQGIIDAMRETCEKEGYDMPVMHADYELDLAEWKLFYNGKQQM